MSLIKVGYSHLNKEYKSVDFIIEADERLWDFVVTQLYHQENIDLNEYDSTRILKSDLESPYTTWYSTQEIEIVVNSGSVSEQFYRWLEDQGFNLVNSRGLQTEEDAEIVYELEDIYDSWD